LVTPAPAKCAAANGGHHGIVKLPSSPLPRNEDGGLVWQVISFEAKMLSDCVCRFLAEMRIAHLATADCRAIPHVVPVCFAVSGERLYVTIDRKPKRQPAATLKRLKNIAENPAVAVVVDRYDEDWARLGWVMLHGRALVLADGVEHNDAQALLCSRYPQLAAMQITELPVIAVHIQRVTSWGNLAPRPIIPSTAVPARGPPNSPASDT
jgi:PPOX class probable F420-dependent enzyme